MPDRHGRINFQDGMTMANQGMGLMNQMKRTDIYAAELENINQAKEDKNQVGLGLAALQNGQEMPEDISSINRFKAQSYHTQGLANKDQQAQYTFNANVKARANEYIPILQKNNFNFDVIKPTDSAGIAAVASLAKTYGDTEQGKNLLHQNRSELLGRKYQEFQAGTKQVNQLLQEGRTDEALAGIENLTKAAPMPYHLDNFDPKSQTFAVKYIDSTKGAQETQRMGLKEVMQTINSMGGKQFFQQSAQHAEAIRQNNFEKRMNPKFHMRATDGNKNSITIVPQKNINDMGDIDYLVYPEGGGDPYTIRSMAELKKRGIVFEDLDRAKSLVSIEATKQGIASSKQSMATSLANQKLYEAKTKTAGVETHNKQITQARNAFSDMAKMLKSVKDGDGMTFSFPDADSLDNMAPEDRKPFMQKVIEISQDKKLSNETRSTAQRYIQLGQQLGYIQPPPSKEQISQAEEINKLRQQGFSDDSIRAIYSQRNPPANQGPDKGVHVMSFGSPDTGSIPVQAEAPSSQAASPGRGLPAAQESPADTHPLAAYRGRAVVDKNGQIWAKDKNGQARRIQEKPSEKIRNGKGQIVENPSYQEYLNNLNYLGLKA
ncbi:hypothetical protein [Maridesulfovibrio ferrireducens]|uniref:hypothetical protein n=1 Tax=Maridesulfovibrio ferrireducens TaxID=246191 RepID=UPI001A1EBF9F|nr:hypothetical protein [Maridesulfovibrio ferrireducens]MBI9113165.1 hypothetical protein [Maridesulfovibrio ferrireducens]